MRDAWSTTCAVDAPSSVNSVNTWSICPRRRCSVSWELMIRVCAASVTLTKRTSSWRTISGSPSRSAAATNEAGAPRNLRPSSITSALARAPARLSTHSTTGPGSSGSPMPVVSRNSPPLRGERCRPARQRAPSGPHWSGRSHPRASREVPRRAQEAPGSAPPSEALTGCNRLSQAPFNLLLTHQQSQP